MRNFVNNVIIPFVGGALIALCLLGIFAWAFSQGQQTIVENEAKTYGRISHVVELDNKDDVVVVEDEFGHLWEFYGIEDWQVNDCVVLVMNDQGTQAMEDDTIVSTTYSAIG